jgi:hypothetical protein
MHNKTVFLALWKRKQLVVFGDLHMSSPKVQNDNAKVHHRGFTERVTTIELQNKCTIKTVLLTLWKRKQLVVFGVLYLSSPKQMHNKILLAHISTTSLTKKILLLTYKHNFAHDDKIVACLKA